MLNPEHATQALVTMAKRRGLHASPQEAQQEWDGVTAEADAQRLSLSWQRLFDRHRVERAPVALLTNAQLPAWVLHGDRVGILRQLATDDAPPVIEWFGVANQQDELPELNACTVLVPLQPLGQRKSFIKRKARKPASAVVVEAMKAHMPLYRRAAAATVCINLIAVLSSLFAMQVYDRVVPNFAYATLWYLAGGLAVAYVLDLAFKFARLGLMEAMKHQLDEVMALHIFERLLGLKIDRRPAWQGTLAAQVNDYQSIKAFFSSTTLFALADLPFVLVFIAIIYTLGQEVAYVPAVFVLVSLAVGLLAYRPTARAQRLNNDAITLRHGMLYESIAGGEIIKASGGESKFGDVWLSSTKEVADRGEALAKVMARAQYVTQFFQQISYIAIIVVGVAVIDRGDLTMGGLIACSILGSRALAYISNISSVLLQWHNAKYALDILNDLLDLPSDAKPERNANTQSQPLHLDLEQVVYAYQGATVPQLQVEKLHIGAGERIALLGRNGSGKTTLLKLLAGIYTPVNGQVRIAGLDYEHCRPSWLRQEIGYLPQDPRLFSGTLLDNLTLGLTMPDESEIWKALEATGLADAVRAHPQGLQLPIHEGGSGLSGGQRQVVGLTRLVLQNPKIWILDEPSASLDREVENSVMQLLGNLPADKTLIFTTHRKSWMQLASRVVVIENGQIKIDSPTDQVNVVTAADKAADEAGNAAQPEPANA